MLRDLIAALLTIVAVGAITYAGVVRENQVAMGALIAVPAASSGYYLLNRPETRKFRGGNEPPETTETTEEDS